MTETILVLSLAGLLAGFMLSMPLAGPISILITSNALKGRLKYCRLATVGASIPDFIFIVIAVYGITKLYNVYQPYIPYVLLVGAVFLIFVGYKIFKSKIEIEHPHETAMAIKIEKQHRGGFFTGFMISFLNPTLFLSWLTSSFFIISFVSSMGFNTGGLAQSMDVTFKEMKSTNKHIHVESKSSDTATSSAATVAQTSEEENPDATPGYFPLVLSLCYAFFVSIGSICWFFFLAWFIGKHRHRLDVKLMNRMIQISGLVLCLFGVALGYKGIRLL